MNLRRNPRHPLIAAAIAAAAFLLSVGYSSVSSAVAPHLLPQPLVTRDATASERVIWDVEGAASSDAPALFVGTHQMPVAWRRRAAGERTRFYFFCTTCKLIESDPYQRSNWIDKFLGIRCLNCGNRSLKSTNFTDVDHTWIRYDYSDFTKRSKFRCSCGNDTYDTYWTDWTPSGHVPSRREKFCKHDIRGLYAPIDPRVIVADSLIPDAIVAAGVNPEILSLTDDKRVLPDGVFQGMTNLETLRMRNNNLKVLQPGVFHGLTNLQTLDLDGNKLKKLSPGAFDGLTNLEELDLSHNELKKLPPGVFDGLTSLKTLNLGGNRVKKLPPGVFDGLTSLKTLNLDGNKLRKLSPGAFDGLTDLEELDLSHNELKNLPPGVFGGLTNLKTLNLGGNRVKKLRPGVFDGLTNLKTLNLGGNRVKKLRPGVFDGLTSLKTLNLHGNKLKKLLPGVFDSLTSLEILNLSGSIGSHFLTAQASPSSNKLKKLPPGVFDGLINLKTLDLSRNPGAPFAIIHPSADLHCRGCVVHQ